jgi:hypothetical protein
VTALGGTAAVGRGVAVVTGGAVAAGVAVTKSNWDIGPGREHPRRMMPSTNRPSPVIVRVFKLFPF